MTARYVEARYVDVVPALYVDVVFDGPPGPEAPRFIEVEDEQGRSIKYGEWVQRSDGSWALRIPASA